MWGESKHTKVWSDAWYQKLKDDLRLVKGDVAVLVTEALPKGVQHLALLNGIWVTSPACALGLAVALHNTAGMHGDLQGIIGTELQTIPALTAGEEEDAPAEVPALGASGTLQGEGVAASLRSTRGSLISSL